MTFDTTFSTDWRRVTRRGTFVASALACACLPVSAHAAYVINFDEVGPNVVMTGSGSIDLSGLTAFGAGGGPTTTNVAPNSGQVFVERPGNNIIVYRGFTGPLSFGTSAAQTAVSSIASHVFLFSASSPNPSGPPGRIGLANNYVSGTFLGTNVVTFAGSFASLGLTPGTYEWTWGSGMSADSLTINIGSVVPPGAVPEPATWAMLILGFGVIGGALRRKYRTRQEARLALR